MAGKNLLPTAGGSPATWNSCMAFFQLLLLGGYLWAHVSVKKAGVSRQSLIQVCLAATALAFLGRLLKTDDTIGNNPSFWVMYQLFKTVGLPFFVLAALSPLLQVWFANTGHPQSSDPYFLYAAGNCGSFAALLAFPLLIEPNLRLGTQANLFGLLFVILLLMLVVCRAYIKSGEQAENVTITGPEEASAPTGNRILWVIAAFIPSSMLLATTQFITTDIAPVPLLWVLPLIAYLATFIIAFSKTGVGSNAIEQCAMAGVLLFPAGFFLLTNHLWVGIPLHLFTLFSVSLLCHDWLACNRPNTSRLTEFFAFISLGGCLGGIFNTFLFPGFFSTFAEYPLMIVVACLMFKRFKSNANNGDGPEESISLSVVIGIYAAALLAMTNHLNLPLFFQQLSAYTGFDATRAPISEIIMLLHNYQMAFRAVILALFSLFPLFLVKKMPRLNLALFLLIVMSFLFVWKTGNQSVSLFRARNFFGIKNVQYNPRLKIRSLLHGTTIHGNQNTQPEYSGRPLTYFHPLGPIGQIFKLPAAAKNNLRVAVIGMGVGSIAAYARPGNEFTFFELDPQIISIAQNPNLFTFIADKAETCRIVCGDGRQMIKQFPGQYFDMIILDAFSSDAIPMHLLTIEAVKEYLHRLKPDGLMVFHITNRHLDLKPVIAATAASCNLSGLSIGDDYFDSEAPENFQRFQSDYIVLSQDLSLLRLLVEDAAAGWRRLVNDNMVQPWSDDFSSLLAAINLFKPAVED